MLSFNYSMLVTLLYFTSIMFETHSVEFSDLLINAKNHYKIADKEVRNNRCFYIDKPSCHVKYYVHEDATSAVLHNIHTNGLYELMACLNCMFADWIKHELIVLVLRFLPIYNSKYTHKINNQFETHYEEVMNKLQHILNYSKRFEEIILNYYLFVYESDPYFDMELLWSLVSLDFKIELIKKLKRKSSLVSDDTLVGMLLLVANSIQRFMHYNCKESAATYGVNQLFGFFIYSGYSQKLNIDTFLAELEELKLESNDCCDIKKTLLLEYVDQFSSVNWIVDSKKMNIGDAAKFVEKNYDLEPTYWFQNNMFNTIMTLLFSIAQSMIERKEEFSEDTRTYFKHLRSNVLFGCTNLPIELENCFKFLELNKPKELELAIQKYKDSVNRIIDVQSLFNGMSLYTIDEFIIKTDKMFKNFNCFIRRLVFLQNEKDKYYQPNPFSQKLMKNHSLSVKITNSRPNNEYTQDLCTCFIRLYQICVDINISIKNSWNNQNQYTKKIILKAVNRKLLMVTIISEIIFRKYSDVIDLNIIHNILSLIDVFSEKYLTNYTFINLNSLIYSIIYELNFLSLRDCSVPTYNFLFYNNMIFQRFGRIYVIKYEIHNLLNTTILNNKLMDKNIPIIYNFHRDLIHITNYVFKNYKDVISINWIGVRLSIYDIYDILEVGSFKYSKIRSLFHIFAFNDVVHKFLIASIFLETYQLRIVEQNLNGLSREYIRQDALNSLNSISEYPYPIVFDRVMRDIQEYVNAKITSGNTDEIERKFEQIDRQFIKFGVFIEFDKVGKNSKQMICNYIKVIIDLVKWKNFLGPKSVANNNNSGI